MMIIIVLVCLFEITWSRMVKKKREKFGLLNSRQDELLLHPEVKHCSLAAFFERHPPQQRDTHHSFFFFPTGLNHLFLRQIITVTAQIMLFHSPLTLPSASVLPFSLILVCKRPIWVSLGCDFVPWKLSHPKKQKQSKAKQNKTRKSNTNDEHPNYDVPRTSKPLCSSTLHRRLKATYFASQDLRA